MMDGLAELDDERNMAALRGVGQAFQGPDRFHLQLGLHPAREA